MLNLNEIYQHYKVGVERVKRALNYVIINKVDWYLRAVNKA